ncbi:hypothetical protein [Micromonospora tulbaghiae]
MAVDEEHGGRVVLVEVADLPVRIRLSRHAANSRWSSGREPSQASQVPNDAANKPQTTAKTDDKATTERLAGRPSRAHRPWRTRFAANRLRRWAEPTSRTVSRISAPRARR